MCKVNTNCDQNWAMRNVYKSLTLCRSCSRLLFSCSYMHSQSVTGTHPHTSFQADFGDDGPERDASLDGSWTHRRRSLHAHLLSIRVWCWWVLLGTDYLVWIRRFGEIHRATFIGGQGHWCYVWSLRNRDRKTKRQAEKEEDEEKKRKGVNIEWELSPPVGNSFESEEDPFVISIGRKWQMWVKYWLITWRQLYVGQCLGCLL